MNGQSGRWTAYRWLKILALLGTVWMLYAVLIAIPHQAEALRVSREYVEYGENFLDGYRTGAQIGAFGRWLAGIIVIAVLAWLVKPSGAAANSPADEKRVH